MYYHFEHESMQVIEQFGEMSSNKERLVSFGQDVQEISR